MGTVYRARDRVLGDKVAVKVLKPELSRRPEMIRRFRSEMAMARKVRHPNVCRIYAAGEEAGRLYLAMELMDGTDLKTVLRQRKSGLAPEQAFEYAIELAGGLQALHDAGIVHRDVKATNIMVDKRGPRLMDFDIAKQHEAEGKDAAAATLPGTGHSRVHEPGVRARRPGGLPERHRLAGRSHLRDVHRRRSLPR
jgi:serine/threonine-protein kinase